MVQQLRASKGEKVIIGFEQRRTHSTYDREIINRKMVNGKSLIEKTEKIDYGK